MENIMLNKNDAIKLLSTEIGSTEYYKIIGEANEYSRKQFNNKSVIFAQIGLDARPCSVNCKFCMLAKDNFDESNNTKMPVEKILAKAEELILAGANEIFLMTTAEYDKEELLEIGKKVRTLMPKDMRMVVNTGDFDLNFAKRLKETGFTGVYHICRLGESVDTSSSIEDRLVTLKAINDANLELYYCVEPIGPEHSNEQIADEIFRAIEYNVDVMAVMRRIAFKGSPLESRGEINAMRMALICAVATLCVRPKRAMGVHEPEIISLISGANQIYAESGSNPRDTNLTTEKGRGMSVQNAKKMLLDANWELS